MQNHVGLLYETVSYDMYSIMIVCFHITQYDYDKEDEFSTLVLNTSV